MAATKTADLIPTSCDVINSFCGRQKKQFLTYYLPTMFHCHSSNALEVLSGSKSVEISQYRKIQWIGGGGDGRRGVHKLDELHKTVDKGPAGRQRWILKELHEH